MKSLRASSIRERQSVDRRSPVRDFFNRMRSEIQTPLILLSAYVITVGVALCLSPPTEMGAFQPFEGKVEFTMELKNSQNQNRETQVDFSRGPEGSNATISSRTSDCPWTTSTFENFEGVAGLEFGAGPLPREGGVFVGEDGRVLFEIPRQDSLGAIVAPGRLGLKLIGPDSLTVKLKTVRESPAGER